MIQIKRNAVLLLFLSVASVAASQAVPAARGPAVYTGFSLPEISGTLRVSLSLSQRFGLGSDSTGESGSVSGDLAYLSGSAIHPFSAIYSSAYILPESGPSQSDSAQNFSFSQVFALWGLQFILADSVSFLPNAPTSGLSGIPGVGDANNPPVANDQQILTTQATRVTNQVSATTQRQLTNRTSLSLTGSQSLIRFTGAPQGSTTDTNSYSGSVGVQHQFDARTSSGFHYSYSNFSYANSSTTSQTESVDLSRTLSAATSVSGSIGPQRTSSDSALFPSRTSLSVSAALSHTTRSLSTTLSLSRGTSSGSGLIAGTETTSASASASKQIGRAIHLSGNATFSDSSSLIAGAYGGRSLSSSLQANRAIANHLSAFASYSLQHQINSGSAIPGLALTGFNQTLAFGVTYVPEAIHFGR